MKRYIGTKTLMAQPMTRGEYNEYRGWTLPENENGDDAGYLVEYEPDGNPNMPGHDGYVSWSPFIAFVASYKPADTRYDRLLIERDALSEKVAALESFIHGPSFKELPEGDRNLLLAQSRCMAEYISILSKRRIRGEDNRDDMQHAGEDDVS